LTLTLKPRVGLVLVLIAFVALSLYYNAALPLFEGFDEVSHYRVADHYARTWSLPDLNRAPSHEAHQPPLYYLASAALIAPVNRDDFSQVFQVSADAGLNRRQNGVTTTVPTPLAGTALALQLMRLFSTALGAMTIALVYAVANLVSRRAWAGLLASAILAFNPKFIYLSSIASNDVAVCCLAAVALWLSLRLLIRPERATPLVAFGLGVVCGLATMTKLSGLSALAPAGLAVLMCADWRGDRRRALVGASLRLLALGIGFALVAGPFFGHQWSRYGDPLAGPQVRALNLFAARPQPLTLGEIAAIYPQLVPTFWRVGDDAMVQPWLTLVVWVLLGLGLFGFARAAWRREVRLDMAVLLVAALVVPFIALGPWARNYGGTEDARLLSPAYASLAVVLSLGWLNLVRSSAERAVAVAGGVATLAWSLAVPALFIAPLYPPLPPLAPERYIEQVTPAAADALSPRIGAAFDNGIELASASVSADRIRLGQPITVTLFWRVNAPVLDAFDITLEARDDRGDVLGKHDAPPLNGRRATTLWQIGDVFSDTHVLTATAPAGPNATLVTLFAGWHQAAPPYAVSTVKGSDAVSAPIGQVKLLPVASASTPSSTPVGATFGDGIVLDGFDLDGDRITLHWRGEKPQSVDYQVFVHALDAAGVIIGQADGPPPLPTSWWDVDERVLDVRTVPRVQEASRLVVGLYDLATEARLPALQRDGNRWPDDAAVLLTIE
jgi:4-amino-4-deoxy-L-arabinose transferase-like glycosyltransferase